METVELAFDVYEPIKMRPGACPIVLIHGLFWNKYAYRSLAKDLARETERTVYSLDARNHGESPVSKEINVFCAFEDVKRFLNERDLKKIVFVTHSISSTVAYMTALEKPETVEKIVMIDGPPFNDFTEEFYREVITPQMDAQDRVLQTLDPKMKLKDAKSKFLSLAKLGTKAQEIFFEKAAYDLTKEKGVFKWKINMDLILKVYSQKSFAPEPYGSSDHEILIIRCPNSYAVSDSKFESILKYNPRARLETIDDTTHLLMFEKPQEFIGIVKEFLSVS